MPSYQREVIIDGIALRQVPWFEVDTVRLDAPPSRNIEKTSLADTNGEHIMSQQYGSKEVTLKGHFFAPARWDYESGRDELLAVMNKYTAFTIETEQSGDTRRFDGTYQNCKFDYKESGLCVVEISFLITGACGVSVTEDVPIDGETIMDSFSKTFFVHGSAEALPVITLTVNEIVAKTFDIIFEVFSNGRLSRVNIRRYWRPGDVLVVNSTNRTVKRNGEDTFYSGSLPTFLGDTTLSVRDDVDSRKYTLTVTYNRRWL